MPNNTTTLGNKNQKHTKGHNWRRKSLVLLSVVLAVCFVIWFFWGASAVAQIQMAVYLKEKYGKEFLVENYRVEGSGIGVEGDPTADAYPSGDTSLRFEVWDRGTFSIGQHAYSDNFVNAVWSAEQTKAIARELESIMGYKPDYKVTVGFGGELKTYRTIVTFQEALEENSSKMSFQLDIYPRERIDVKSRNLHSGRILQVVGLLKKKGIEAILTYISRDKKTGVYFENNELQSIDSVQAIENVIKEQK